MSDDCRMVSTLDNGGTPCTTVAAGTLSTKLLRPTEAGGPSERFEFLFVDVVGSDYFDQRNKPKVVSRLVQRLTKLGYYVSLEPVEPESRLPDEPAPKTGVQRVPRQEVRPSNLSSEPSRTPQQPVVEKRKGGRPCKCIERGIACKHGRGQNPNLNKVQGLPVAEFS